MAFDPGTECIDHLNVYSKSKSPLGRLLTNFARARIVTEDGAFMSVEGYWYWLSIPDGTPGKDDLRRLWGYRAKCRGRELRKAAGHTRFEERFEDKIRMAVRYKLRHADASALMLPEGELPLAHYYVFDGRVRDVGPKFDWLVAVWREELDSARAMRA